MAKITLTLVADDGLEAQLQLNGHAVLNAPGSVTGEVDAGMHLVQWFLVGDPELTYSVSVHRNGSSLFEYKGTMTKDGKTAGFKKVEVVGETVSGGAQ